MTTSLLAPTAPRTATRPVPDSGDTASTRMRVLLVDDHPITRQGLRALVNQQLNLYVCAETAHATQALELLRSERPDVVIVDISLPETNGIELTKMMKEIAPDVPILAVSMHDEALYAERAIRAGAMGYVMKQEAGEKVALALQQILRGEIYLSPPMKQKMLHRFVNKRGDRAEFAIDTLSNREMEVFRLIGNGFSTRQIATQLGLSAKTIDSYREHLKFKLGLDNGADLMRHAIECVRLEHKPA